MLDVVAFKWRAKAGYRSTFKAEHVNVLARMVKRNYAKPHRFSCITDDPAGIDPDIRIIPLWPDHATIPSPMGGGNPSCYRRLKVFSAEARDIIGPRFVCIDLDTVIVADMAPLFDRTEDFIIWGDTLAGTSYNGSLFMLTAGARRQVWDTFHPVNSPRASRAAGQFGSDQGWIGACLGPNEARWSRADGVYSWRVHLHPHGGHLPPAAKIVIFHGKIDPWAREAQRVEWIRKHWR